MITIVPIAQVDADAVERLLDRAFGGGRRARTAYRIRGGMLAVRQLSFAAMEEGVLVGTIQCWPILFESDDGEDRELVMVGPVAVEPTRQRDGIGRALMRCALDAAESIGEADSLMLIGDPEYYGRFFGFDASLTSAWRVPGPVDPRRLLARGNGIPNRAGVLAPRKSAQT